MKKLLTAAISALMFASPVLAEPEVRGWKTMDSLGCMMMRECTDGTRLVTSMVPIEEENQFSIYDDVRDEANAIIKELADMGVGVYLADDKYFPRGHAGVYYTVGNDFFMNRTYADDPIQFLQTLRHEAYHAAQDAMAGTIENSSIAIIYPEDAVPASYVLMAEIAYPPSARPWEAEAKWAGAEPGMTLEVLRIINRTNGQPWKEIDPTPMTREWLELKGFM
jgi:hypothetical protein